MKIKTLSKSDIKKLNNQLNELYNIEPLSKKDKVQLVEANVKYFKINNEILFFYYDDLVVPTLKNLLKQNFLKKITVDMGAVKFVCSGADIMRPGITDVEDNIKENEIISIIDEKNKQPLAIGTVLFNTEDLRKQEKGKSIKNIHYAGDEIWKL